MPSRPTTSEPRSRTRPVGGRDPRSAKHSVAGIRAGEDRCAAAADRQRKHLPPSSPAIHQASGTLFGYQFRKPELLSLALTHSSLAYEKQHDGQYTPGHDNERLEFIGDAVLGLVVAEALYRHFPALREGELTRMRASLVSRRNLAEVAQRIGLGPLLRLGRGEEHSGGQRKPALLANALEAVIAALYLDGGLSPASDFIQQHIVRPAEPGFTNLLRSSNSIASATGDYKSELQERLQAEGSGQPRYILAEESGPDHQKRFRIEVRIDRPDGSTVRLSEAEGTTKKQAQQEGARLALAALQSSGVNFPSTAGSGEAP